MFCTVRDYKACKYYFHHIGLDCCTYSGNNSPYCSVSTKFRTDPPKRINLITTLEHIDQWPEYLEAEAEYYQLKKLKRDMLGAAEVIRQLLKRLEKV